MKAIMIALASLLPATVSAQHSSAPRPSPALVAADLRPGTDLSGQRHYSIDPYRSGIADFHGDPPNATERRWQEVDVTAAMARGDGALFEYDMAAAPVATLPARWLTHAPAKRYYQGIVWYQRHFAGFAPFAFDVRRLLCDGDNQVTVGVDSQPTEASVPPPVTDWQRSAARAACRTSRGQPHA